MSITDILISNSFVKRFSDSTCLLDELIQIALDSRG